MNTRIIALLTDFGIYDPYVGIMKAVMTEIAPDAKLIDLSHQIPAGDIQRGAFVLWQAARDYPPGSIFLSVVDPGVGTKRKGIILQTDNQVYVGPDNGLFSYLLYRKDYQAWELANSDYQRKGISTTFHGRDIFAPAAAYASLGVHGEGFGNLINDLVHLPKPTLEIQNLSIMGEVLSADHFGNLFTSIGNFIHNKKGLTCRSWLGNATITIPRRAAIQIKIKNQSLPLCTTFGDIPDNQAAGVIGSTGLLEIAANQEPAQHLLSLSVGDPVEVIWKQP